MKRLLLFFATILFILPFISCSKKDKKSDSIVRGKYLYIDKSECIHTQRNCIKILLSEDPDAGKLIRIDTLNIKKSDFKYSCSDCVDDSTYEWIIGLTEEYTGDFSEYIIDND